MQNNHSLEMLSARSRRTSTNHALPVVPSTQGHTQSSNQIQSYSSHNSQNHFQNASRAPTPTRSHLEKYEKSEKSEKATLLVNEAPRKKWHNFLVRTVWTLIMVGGFLGLILAGHISVIFLVCLIQVLVYKEVISIAHLPSKEKKLPWFRTLNWYFLTATSYFLYGESLIYYFKHSFYVDALFTPLATHHRFISFIIYCIGLVLFVMNLKKGHYRFQFSQFGWTHMALLLVVCQSHFIMNNIFEGLIWFILPVALVIVNDICAYICGFFFGKTPLIKLSPKKTWEGFIGALICTFIFAFFFSSWLTQFPYMICPAQDLSSTAFSTQSCLPNPIFVYRNYYIPPSLTSLIKHTLRLENVRTLSIAPIQFHSLAFASFASLIAPFGGFFASGAKRAFKIKDFGDSIPGHGGITDRMDCQFLMGLFSYIYCQSFLKVESTSVGSLLQGAVDGLDTAQQIELWRALGTYLVEQGVLAPGGAVGTLGI